MKKITIYVSIEEYSFLSKMRFCREENGKLITRHQSFDPSIEDMIIEYIPDPLIKSGEAYSPDGEVLNIPIMDEKLQKTEKYIPTLL